MQNLQGEVMWPRLVASKFLRKRLGTNNFVADFPCNTAESTLLEDQLPGLDQDSLSSLNTIFGDHEEIHSYKVFVNTWNVGGVSPPENFDMDEILNSRKNPCDIYVLGFQEVVPLRASNILGSENSKIIVKWNSLVRKALNGKSHRVGRTEEEEEEGKLLEHRKTFPMRKEKSVDSKAMPEFRCIMSKQMVGILISVWVRSDLHPYVQNPSVSCVGCGIMGCLGNKGSVSVRFRLHETSFCFVCTHLASGGREGDERLRNSNAAEILSRTTFPNGVSHDLPRKILDHDRIIFLGDLNYRISLPEGATRILVDQGEWNALLQHDQLNTELNDGHVFSGWQEGNIKFPPTYKYYMNSDKYYGASGAGIKVEKKRAPAWCDRIIWYGKGIQQLSYTRGETKLSDHRPVKAIFTTEVRVLRKLRGVRSFFMSERFDQIASRIDLSSSMQRSNFQIKKRLTTP